VNEAPRPIPVPSTDGVVLALWDLGGDGPPLLLAHATMFCGHLWGPIVRRLADFHCYALDFRAHGHSRTPKGADLTWPSMAQDVLAVIDHLGLAGVRAAGHSMGAACLLLAEMARPGTFARLWCYDPVVRPADALVDGAGPGTTLSAGARRRRAVFPSRQAAYENFATKPPLDTAQPEALEAYVTWGFEELPDGTVRLRCAPEREAEIYDHGGDHGAFERLDEVACPVTIAHGYPEPERPSMWAPQVVSRLPQGREVAFPELSHFGPLEDPAAMAESITATFTPW
jgi:pimeloyl-ACP methyl ester carboxylesterase